MKILVTGGCGFIGSALVRHLVKDGQYQVTNIDKLTYAGHEESLAEVAAMSNYRFHRLDIGDTDGVREVIEECRPDAIMHLAAESHVDRSIEGPADFIETNVLGTFHMLHAATQYYNSLTPTLKASFRFLHVSTDEVYGALGPNGDFTEDSVYRPNSPYAASKAASDHFVRAWHHTYGLPVLTTNCGNNFGPYQHPEKLIPLTILRAIQKKSLPVYGKGENVRDWIYVDDHVRALLTVLRKGKIGETYNIGTRGEQRNIDVVQKICKILDKLLPNASSHHLLIAHVADRPGHDFRYAINPDKLTQNLGFKAQESFESALEKTVAWYVAQQKKWCQVVLEKGQTALDRRGEL